MVPVDRVATPGPDSESACATWPALCTTSRTRPAGGVLVDSEMRYSRSVTVTVVFSGSDRTANAAAAPPSASTATPPRARKWVFIRPVLRRVRANGFLPLAVPLPVPLNPDRVAAPAEERAASEIEVEPPGEGRPGVPLGCVEPGAARADDGERGSGGRDHHDLFAVAVAHAARSANLA